MQVPIQFEFQTSQTFASFFTGNNAEIIGQLQQFVVGGQEQQIYLWGEHGCGKSHLLLACCQLAKSIGKDPFYLAFSPDNLPPPALLEGLDRMQIVCLDNLQYIADDSDWQQALFNFYNEHRQNNHQLMVSADCPPKFLPFTLTDLKTRMAWGLTLKIQALHDCQLIEALVHRARYLGFDIPADVGRFLLNHYAHDLQELWLLLAIIDQATLAAKRKITIPFLKQILKEEMEKPAK